MLVTEILPLNMSCLDLNGVQVTFPFQPYDCQVDYMKKVITCLQTNQNGILESPTGTGKTLSLLCSSLAWQESRKAQVELNKAAGMASALSGLPDGGNAAINAMSEQLNFASGATWGSDEFLVPKIVYASRTHSQLSQAVQELKRTTYSHVKTAVIGSREQLCIHPQVVKATSNTAKVQMCRAKVLARNCHYYNNIEEYKKKGDVRTLMGSVVDIEDMVTKGNKSKTCPYYMARELKTDADIIFLPYNYLLDAKTRKAHGVELQGSVIIFDEAHNLEKICEESASFDLSSLDLATAIEETTKLAEKLADLSASESMMSEEADPVVPEFTLEDIIRLKKTLLEIEEKLESINVISAKEGRTMAGSYIFELLSEVNINWSNKDAFLGVLDRMTQFLGNEDGNSILNTKGAGLSKFADCLKVVFNQDPAHGTSLTTHQKVLSQHFKVHIQKKEPNKFQKNLDSWSTSGKSKKERILSYWCFSPGHTMRDLQAHGVKVIILTSGTLSPMESFTMEMQIPFPIQLENPHVIEKNQVWLGALCKGPNKTTLESSFKNRDNPDYVKDLGYTIRNFSKVVPNGLLVFYPSYPVMEKCIESWKASNIWTMINQHKPVMVEPKGKAAFTEAMDEFYNKVNDPTLGGAIFMAVCRGKVSEGLDFADNNGRAVMITGLPYPPIFDPKVKLKMDFLKENASLKGLDGQTWYRQQATRAVNQAIGRVIRHKRDYGAIILCDTRFSSTASKKALPVWVRDHAQVYEQFGRAFSDVIKFFKEAEKNYPLAEGSGGDKRSRRGEHDGGAGTRAACFEPTFSRRTPGGKGHKGHVSVEYEAASSVACHVSGLGDDGKSTSLEIYSQDIQAERGKKRTLIEALENIESKRVKSSTSPELLQSQIPSAQLPKKKLPGKQKKIKIKDSNLDEFYGASDSIKPQTSKVDTKDDKSDLKKARLITSQNYIKEVKSSVSADSYQSFSQVLKTYKEKRNVNEIIPVLADIFTKEEKHFHLFQNFSQFINEKELGVYAAACKRLTGLELTQWRDKTKPTSSESYIAKVKSVVTPGSLNRFSTDKPIKAEEIKRELNDVTQAKKHRIQMRNSGDYVAEVKTVLTKELYHRFEKALVEYHQKYKILDFIPVMADIFIKEAKQLYLFQSLYDFIVRPEDQAVFYEACQKLTDLEVNQLQDKPQLSPEQRYFAEVKLAVSPACCARLHEVLDVYRKEKKLKEIIHVLVDIFINQEKNFHLFQKFNQFVLEKDHPFFSDVCSEFTGLICDPNDCIKDIGFECQICHCRPPEQGLRHECGAVCCFKCWISDVFNGPEDRKCPYSKCSVRVKRKYLQKVSDERPPSPLGATYINFVKQKRLLPSINKPWANFRPHK